ncbi:hypothetical protein [Massilia sp. 9096]|uniref:hypothetical protein n=1 Tax=Massilia sp. 9096 TaxID=1500894 RepID=UPI0012E0B6AE|nr:hypothetical protein [Massilia sp. 9096]
MKTLFLCMALSWVACTSAKAQESLFVAHVERVTLEPRGGQYCADLCAASGRHNPDGTTYVCISNDGGCDKTEFVVDRVLLGDMQPGPHTFDTRIGEWGGTHFPITHQPILVHMKPGFVEWAPVKVKDGKELAQVKAFRHGGIVSGVDLRSLAQGDEDTVTLDALIEHLPTRR